MSQTASKCKKPYENRYKIEHNIDLYNTGKGNSKNRSIIIEDKNKPVIGKLNNTPL